eukprot:ANDGO_08511.mRNA.1 hypothetical protein
MADCCTPFPRSIPSSIIVRGFVFLSRATRIAFCELFVKHCQDRREEHVCMITVVGDASVSTLSLLLYLAGTKSMVTWIESVSSVPRLEDAYFLASLPYVQFLTDIGLWSEVLDRAVYKIPDCKDYFYSFSSEKLKEILRRKLLFFVPLFVHMFQWDSEKVSLSRLDVATASVEFSECLLPAVGCTVDGHPAHSKHFQDSDLLLVTSVTSSLEMCLSRFVGSSFQLPGLCRRNAQCGSQVVYRHTFLASCSPEKNRGGEDLQESSRRGTPLRQGILRGREPCTRAVPWLYRFDSVDSLVSLFPADCSSVFGVCFSSSEAPSFLAESKDSLLWTTLDKCFQRSVRHLFVGKVCVLANFRVDTCGDPFLATSQSLLDVIAACRCLDGTNLKSDFLENEVYSALSKFEEERLHAIECADWSKVFRDRLCQMLTLPLWQRHAIDTLRTRDYYKMQWFDGLGLSLMAKWALAGKRPFPRTLIFQEWKRRQDRKQRRRDLVRSWCDPSEFDAGRSAESSSDPITAQSLSRRFLGRAFAASSQNSSTAPGEQLLDRVVLSRIVRLMRHLLPSPN